MWCDTIIGQKLAVRLLQSAMKQDRLAQSYLFYGPVGVGKAYTATKLAQAVQCDAGFGIGCGECPSCQKIARSTHPDFHLIEPDGNNIRIDQIRELQGVISRRPHLGRRRIAVFDPAEKLNDPSSNALLKLLEEPPADSLLILISSNPTHLLPTIRSRCQPVRFSRLSKKVLASSLSEDISGEAKRLLLTSARGSMGNLRDLIDDNEWVAQRQKFIEWYTMEPSWGIIERLKFAEEREADLREREKWLELWSIWLSLTRDRLMMITGAAEEQLWNPDAIDKLRSMPKISALQLNRRMTELKEAHMQLTTYTSPRLVAESVLLGWHTQ